MAARRALEWIVILKCPAGILGMKYQPTQTKEQNWGWPGNETRKE